MSVLVEKKQVLEDAETIAVLGKCGNVPVYTAEFEVLTKLTGFKLTRGMLCAMKRRRLPGLQEICSGCDRIAVLENVTYKCRSDFPLCGSTSHGRGDSDRGMQ